MNEESRSRRHISTKVLIAIAAVLVVGLIWFATRPDPVQVSVAEVGRGTVEETVANTRAGTVKACRRAKLSPLVGGKVEALPIQEGSRVKQGDLLLALWDDDLTARLHLAESEGRAAHARAEQACLLAEQSQREAARLSALKSEGIATEEAYDRASTTAQANQAACRAAKGAAQVADAQVETVRTELSRTRLNAPFDGVVAEVNAELYELVTPSPVGVPTPPAVDLIDDTCLYVSAPIDEVDAPRVRPGMPARVVLDAFSDQTFPATVRRVAPYVLDVEKQSRTVEVEAEFSAPNQVPWLLPGLSADLEVILSARDNALRVPTMAVLGEGRVLVVSSLTGILEEQSFTAGLTNWSFTEVTDGLSEGQQVVTSLETEGVRAGARVEAVPASP